jgi:hypothetical protein
MADIARERYARLMEWVDRPHEYGLKALIPGFEGYERDVVDMLSRLLGKRLEYSSLHWDGDEFHSGEQNANLVKGKSYEGASYVFYFCILTEASTQMQRTTTGPCITVETSRGTYATRTCSRH